MLTTNYWNLISDTLKAFFPNVWKRGIAVYTYSDSSLEYSINKVNVGELVAPTVQMPKCSIF